jgi:CMP-N,N'-diacetyllegionaminic acid synthase
MEKKKSNFVAIIPARSGSKGIKNKNTILLRKKELIKYTFDAVKRSKNIDNIYLTSNDKKVIKIALKYREINTLIRSKKLSKDNSLIADAVCDALLKVKKKSPNILYFILLQPTSPQRTTMDINNAIKFFINNGNNNLISVSEPITHPYELLSINKNSYSQLIKRQKNLNRQNYKKFYFINGSIFIGSIEKFLKTKKFLDKKTIFFKMTKKHSIDLNDYFDKQLIKSFL